MIVFLGFGGHCLYMGDTQDADFFKKKPKIILYINFMLPFYLTIDASGKFC